MSNSAKIIIALVAVAVIALGAVFLFGGNDSGNDNNNTGTNNGASAGSENETAAPDPAEAPEADITLTYTSGGFTPSTITASVGDTVAIVNESDAVIAPSSDNHPTHTLNPELNFFDIDPGQTGTVTVNETGEWGIHNHYQEDHRATIIVE